MVFVIQEQQVSCAGQVYCIEASNNKAAQDHLHTTGIDRDGTIVSGMTEAIDPSMGGSNLRYK